MPYLDTGTGGASAGNFIVDSTGTGAIYTPEMQQISINGAGYEGNVTSGNVINGFITDGTHGPVAGYTTAHMRLFWDPNTRTTTSPKVFIYLPQFQ